MTEPERLRLPSPWAMRTVIRWHLALLAVFVALGLFYCDRSYDPLPLVDPLTNALVWCCVWCAVSWLLLMCEWLWPYFTFLATFMVYHAGQAFNQFLGFADKMLWTREFDPIFIVQAQYLAVVCLLTLHLGALWALSQEVRAPAVAGEPGADQLDLRRVGWFLLAISAGPTISAFKSTLATVYASGYFAYKADQMLNPQMGLDVALSRLSGFTVPGFMFLVAGCREQPVMRRIAMGLFALYILSHVALGDRGEVAGPLLMMLWLWHFVHRRMPTRALVMGVLAMTLLMFPAMKAVRNLSGVDRFDAGALAEAYTARVDNPVTSILDELGSQVGIVGHTLELVPSSRPFEWGSGYLWVLFLLVPNLFWKIHPSALHVLYGNWYTDMVYPMKRLIGGSTGFTVVAEAYINAGYVGAPLVLLIIGFAIAKLGFWATRTSRPDRVAMAATFMSFGILWARSSSANMIRQLVYCAMIPYLVAGVLTRDRQKAQADRTGEGA